jgi:hypothetical protein
MVYSREQLLKAVRDAGLDGQPFTLGTVREQLGLKTRDKRELKRFRSRFRECCSSFGPAGIEKLGPNTYRLTAAAAPARASRGSDLAARSASSLIERVGVSARQPRVAAAAPELVREELRTSAALSARASEDDVPPARGASEVGRGLGARVMSFFGRLRGQPQNTAATALSRLAVELQPNAANFQYRCIDGKMRVSVAQTEARGRGNPFS